MERGIGKRLFEMLNNGYMTDVTFVVQGTEIKGHRVVASSRGGVLKDLVKNRSKRVVIDEEVSPDTFRAVLEFLYTDDCQVSLTNVSKLVEAAKLFQLESLEHYCTEAEEFILAARRLVIDKIMTFNLEGYLKVCQQYFRTNSSKIIESKEYLDFSKEVFAAFCGTEDMPCSELELFFACVEYGKRECKSLGLKSTPENLRSVVKDALAKIDFTDIPREDFLESVVPLGLLTNEEIGKTIVEWQRDQRATKIKVRVRDERSETYRRYGDAFMFINVALCVPLCTRVLQIKKMALTKQCDKAFFPETAIDAMVSTPTDKFTLGHKGKELGDDVMLASIYTPGEELKLEVYSLTLVVKYTNKESEEDSWEFPITIKTSDLERGANIIQGQLYGYKDIRPETIKALDSNLNLVPRRLPGDIVYVNLPMKRSWSDTASDWFGYILCLVCVCFLIFRSYLCS